MPDAPEIPEAKDPLIAGRDDHSHLAIAYHSCDYEDQRETAALLRRAEA